MVVWGGSFFKPSAFPTYSLRVCPLLPAAEPGAVAEKDLFSGCRFVVWRLFAATCASLPRGRASPSELSRC